MLVPVREALQLPQSDFHDQRLKEALVKLRRSRDSMCQFYPAWDNLYEVYKGRRFVDKADERARERKEPMKMVVPMSYAQVQIFVAYCMQLFTQRENFYELQGSGLEDIKAALLAESVLQRDLNWNQFYVILYQFLLNIGIFGLGVIKHSWHKQVTKQLVTVQGQPTPTLFGGMVPGTTQQVLQDVTKFLGNKLVTISPYRWFPDPHIPTNQFQEGDYCASENDVSMMFLRKGQQAGMFAGVEQIKDMSVDLWNQRTEAGLRSNIVWDRGTNRQKGGVLITEVQEELIPIEYKMPNGSALGPEDYPVKYVTVIANDSRVIKCEPMNYMHGHFTYSAAQLSPDQHTKINEGVAGLISELQDIITFLYNSRVTSVRKTIHNQVVVDPEGIEMQDLTERRSIIRMKKAAARSGVDRWIQPIAFNDVTQSHITDAMQLGNVIQMVLGHSQNAEGRYSEGRRSAEQTKSVNAASGSRLKTEAGLIWVQGLQPLGEDMLSNLRDGLDIPQLVKVVGKQLLQPQSPYAPNIADAVQFLGVTKNDLVGNYDFLMLDGTSPTEKYAIANILQEVLQSLIANPMAIAILGLDPKKIMARIAVLQGIRNPEEFFLDQIQQQAMLAAGAMAQGTPAGQMAGAAGASGQMTSAAAGVQPGFDLSKLISGGGGSGVVLPNIGGGSSGLGY